MAWDDLFKGGLSSIGGIPGMVSKILPIGDPTISTEPTYRGTGSEIPNDILKYAGIVNKSEDAELANVYNQQDAAHQAYLKDLRGAQGDYEASQEPSMLEKAYKGALGGLGSIKQAVGGGIHSLGLGIDKASPYLAGAAPAIGAIAGYAGSSKLRDESQQAYKDMLAAAGQQVQVGPSAAEDLEDSEEDLQARAKAMQAFQQRAEMGLTPEDQAMLKQARQQSDEAFQANLAKQQTDLARRGMSQSPGMAAVQAQQTAQDLARRQSEEADRQAQMSMQQKMAAAGQLGSMASSNLQQDFSRGLAKAQSADEIARFNAQQQQARANRMMSAGQVQGTQLGQAAGAKAEAFGKMGEAAGGLFAGIANKGKPAQTASTAPTININTQQQPLQAPQQTKKA